jgi:hypothetical protein
MRILTVRTVPVQNAYSEYSPLAGVSQAGSSAAGGTDLRDRPTLQADCSDCRRGDGHGEREEDNAHDQRGREDHLRSDVSFHCRNDGLSDYGEPS